MNGERKTIQYLLKLVTDLEKEADAEKWEWWAKRPMLLETPSRLEDQISHRVEKAKILHGMKSTLEQLVKDEKRYA